jgi:hypothetical protein
VGFVAARASRSWSVLERILVGQLAEVLWVTRLDEETERITKPEG